MPSSQSQIFLFLLVFLAGIVVGALIFWLISGRDKEAPLSPELARLDQLRQQYQERVSLWVDRSTGKLTVRIDDRMASSTQQLSEPQRRQLQTLMREWLLWMGFPGNTPPESSAPGHMVERSVPSQPVMAMPATTARAAASASPAAVAAATPIPSQPVVVPQAPKSIVEQINEILQGKLLSSPLANKGVRLVEDPKLGVVVWVGLNRFNGVDGVTDPEVKAILKASAAEWEQRAGRV